MSACRNGWNNDRGTFVSIPADLETQREGLYVDRDERVTAPGGAVAPSQEPFDYGFVLLPGGKPANIFATALSTSASSFCGEPDAVPVAVPRQMACLVRLSNRSTTNVPTS